MLNIFSVMHISFWSMRKNPSAISLTKRKEQSASILQSCELHLSWAIHHTDPLVMTNIAIEHDPVEIVDLPIDSMVDLSIVFWDGLPGRVHIQQTLRSFAATAYAACRYWRCQQFDATFHTGLYWRKTKKQQLGSQAGWSQTMVTMPSPDIDELGYPLVMTNIAMENHHKNPLFRLGHFQCRKLLVITRG